MNNDLISREAVFNWFCKSADIDGCVDLPKNNGSCKKGCRHCIDGKELDEIPTADAVEVVRCRDCIHSMWDAFCKCYWCKGKERTADFFCADGERKEDG